MSEHLPDEQEMLRQRALAALKLRRNAAGVFVPLMPPGYHEWTSNVLDEAYDVPVRALLTQEPKPEEPHCHCHRMFPNAHEEGCHLARKVQEPKGVAHQAWCSVFLPSNIPLPCDCRAVTQEPKP